MINQILWLCIIGYSLNSSLPKYFPPDQSSNKNLNCKLGRGV